MHISKIASAVSLAILLGLGAPAIAQEAKSMTPFEKADFNGDGQISHEEYRNRAALLFHDYDTNSDGYLTSDELPEYRNAKGEVVVPSALTITDYMASISHSFDLGDVNKDGFLQSSEWGTAPSLNK
jgi:Ca2+-binding EF-hand superfamily protein